MVDVLQETVSVRLMSGTILLEDAWPDYLDSQVKRVLTEKGLYCPRPTDVERLNGVRYHLHYVGENKQHCCEYFLHGQKKLIVVPTSSKYFNLSDADANTIRDEHYAYLTKKAVELRFARCAYCDAYSCNDEPIRHTNRACIHSECMFVDRYA